MENAKLNSLAAAAAQANTDRLAASVVRSLSPGSLNPSTSSSQTGSPNFNHKISGIPCVAAASRYTAPVHIDVGGTIYTSSLETLTKYPESRLARMFNGSIPIVLDSLKQHYFIDRDGEMFRHILNFLRTSAAPVNEDYPELDLLYEEAKFYAISQLIRLLEELRKQRFEKALRSLTCPVTCSRIAQSSSANINKNGKLSRTQNTSNTTLVYLNDSDDAHHLLHRHLLVYSALSCCSPGHPGIITPACGGRRASNSSTSITTIPPITSINVNNNSSASAKNAVNIGSTNTTASANVTQTLMTNSTNTMSPTSSSFSDPIESDFQCISLNVRLECELIMISGRRTIVEEIFPEIIASLMDSRTNVTWIQDSKYIIRFPLNGYCKLNSLQTISRLLNYGFRIIASTGGGSEGQQYNEYLFARNRMNHECD
ncbi:BTB/POZ domain-containing protein kctd15-like isoform X1 [Tetranychus urticae]|uniref:BTB/POZ domain-containing protein kctd15-like isoform X1 n=1 Tax=Tetranychus urticae TaxID=32264 RepID=UPI000D645355|nr:BTB/POZ domain-containing protein kctd15-like isoform X1 [Tetranychus urticae]